jgi:DeoR family transcriptional regulator, suf operon transcriptional repressor
MPPGTKYEILKLLIKEEFSAQALAERLSVTPAAVRQHLETLDALGFVVRRSVSTQPGRPTFLYRLSPDGLRLFPKRYELLLGLVVEALLERHGPDTMADAIRAAAQRLADRVRERLHRGSEAERWRLLTNWLEEELAWQADVSVDDQDRHTITIHHCPFQAVSQAHVIVCREFFTTLVRALYADVPVEHVPLGTVACCALVIDHPS